MFWANTGKHGHCLKNMLEGVFLQRYICNVETLTEEVHSLIRLRHLDSHLCLTYFPCISLLRNSSLILTTYTIILVVLLEY